MFLLLSGEGASDIGIDDAIGPMAKLIDNWIARRSSYSLIELGHYTIVNKQRLAEVAKQHIKPLSRKGKKRKIETGYYYNNARALAILAKTKSNEDGTPVILVLFRDADGTASSNRGEWNEKKQSMLDGFEAEGVSNGVPMIPKPKSEAWILCALHNQYQNCVQLEDESGNDASPNSLKGQLEQCLETPGTSHLLNDLIDKGNIDIGRITDMPSLTAFKNRLDEVLDQHL